MPVLSTCEISQEKDKNLACIFPVVEWNSSELRKSISLSCWWLFLFLLFCCHFQDWVWLRVGLGLGLGWGVEEWGWGENFFVYCGSTLPFQKAVQQKHNQKKSKKKKQPPPQTQNPNNAKRDTRTVVWSGMEAVQLVMAETQARAGKLSQKKQSSKKKRSTETKKPEKARGNSWAQGKQCGFVQWSGVFQNLAYFFCWYWLFLLLFKQWNISWFMTSASSPQEVFWGGQISPQI